MEVDPDAEAAAEEEEDDSVFGLKLLPLTHALHQKHGLRHDDYQRYRGYCSRSGWNWGEGEEWRKNGPMLCVRAKRRLRLASVPICVMIMSKKWGNQPHFFV